MRRTLAAIWLIVLGLIVGPLSSQVIVRPEIPQITSLSPTSGAVTSSVTLTGKQFGPKQENSTVTIKGVVATVTAWGNTSITAIVPLTTLGAGPVVVIRGGVSSQPLTYTVTFIPPTLTNLSVTGGPVGTSVVLTGTNFGATQGTSTVSFNGTLASASAWSQTSITTTVPAGATTGPVTVTVGGFVSNGLTFTVAPPPVLTSLNINTGSVGTTVVATGNNFGATQGTSTIKFNGTVATVSAWGNTSITSTVPMGATTGPVTVTTPAGTSSGITFTVTAGSSVPAVDCTWQAVVNAMGTAFNAVPKILLVTIPACSLTSWPSQLSVGEVGWPVTIQGAGETQTFIDATAYGTPGGGSGATPPIIQVQYGARITGINLTCGLIQMIGSGVRIDHNTFTCGLQWNLWGTAVLADNTNKQAFGVNPLTSQLKGLIDNNHFDSMRIIAYHYNATTLADEQGSTLYSDPLGLGTDNAIYIEDNQFLASNVNAVNVVDCQHAGAYVFRHNTVVDLYPEAHTARGYSRACRKWEIYDGQWSGTRAPLAFLIRGGAGVFFNNTYTGTFGNNKGGIDVARVTVNDGPNSWGLCNGASPWDGNAGNVSAPGWPCLDQIGRGTDALGPFNGTPPPYSPPPQTSDPAYFWNNKINSADLQIGIQDAASVPYLVLNRDYFNSPSTAKPGYVPYPYPHPLQGLPTILSLSPTSGPVGTSVVISGANFGATKGTSLFKFNGTTAATTAWSDTSITATVPAGATTGLVSVTVNAVLYTNTPGMTFTVTTAPPVLTSINPTTGTAGTPVTLTGTSFGATQGTSTVTFNGATATPTSWADTSIAVPAPLGVTTGFVRVTTAAGQSNGIQFTVPVVTTFYVSPAGNDGNNCTQAQNINTPKRTINSAVTCLVPNSQLLVRAGTYAESLLSGDGVIRGPTLIPSGTSWNAKVRIAAYPGETVLMQPTSGNFIIYFGGTHRYIEFDGINMNGANIANASVFMDDRCAMDGACTAQELLTPDHIRMQNADVHHREGPGQSNAAILMAGSNHEWLNLTVHGTGGPYGFYVHGNNNLIDKCDIHDVSSQGVQIYDATGNHPIFNNTVSNSKIHNITQSWFFGNPDTRLWGVLETGTGNVIYNNLFYALNIPYVATSYPAGINISGNNTKVYYNTIYNNNNLGMILGGVTGADIANNIVFVFVGQAIDSTSFSPVSPNIRTNLLGIDPSFVGYAPTYNLHIDSSVAPGNGNATPLVTAAQCAATPPNPLCFDFDGVARGITNPDIGAYEWVAH